MDNERQRHLLSAYRRRRRRESWKAGRRSLSGVAGEIVAGIAGTTIAFRIFSSGEWWSNVVVPILGGLIAVAVWELVIRPASHFIWTFPTQDYWRVDTERREELSAVQAKLDALQGSPQNRVLEGDDSHEEYARGPEAFNVKFDFGKRFAVWSDHLPEQEIWVVLTDVMLTNGAATQVPLDFWIFSGRVVDGSYRVGERTTSAPPASWVIERLNRHIGSLEFLASPINLQARSSSKRGYCAVQFFARDLKSMDAGGAKELVDELPLWFQIHNNITGQQIDHPLNSAAHLVDSRQRMHRKVIETNG